MSIFTDSDLADFGALAIDLAFKDSCEIMRATTVRDDQNGLDSGAWPWPVHETVPCVVIDDLAPRLSVVAEQTTGRTTKDIMLPRLTDVILTDKLRINGTDLYDIVDLLDPISYEVVRRVVCLRQEVGN